MSIDTMIQLHNDYMLGDVNRRIAFQQAAGRYELEFERSFSRRLERRAEDRRQWFQSILPRIKEEARLRAYERELAAN